MAMASAPEMDDGTGKVQWRRQPVFCLLRATLQHSLEQYVNNGGRKIGAWTQKHRCATVPFDAPGDDAQAFCNANTLAELQALHGSGSGISVQR